MFLKNMSNEDSKHGYRSLAIYISVKSEPWEPPGGHDRTAPPS